MASVSLSQKVRYSLAVTAVLGTMVGMSSTIAYFSSRQNTDPNTLQTGTLEIDVTQVTPLAVTNWQPGESKQLEFTVKNVGQLPLHAQAKLEASWSDQLLSTEVIKLMSVERWFAGNWMPVSSIPQLATDPMFISTDGTEATLLSLSTNQQERYRMILQLSPDAGDEYQGKSLSGAVAVIAKQTTVGAPWPTE